MGTVSSVKEESAPEGAWRCQQSLAGDEVCVEWSI